MRVLWGRATSSNVMKVIWLLAEQDETYERRDVGGPFGQTDTEDYGAMNPTRLVPTWQEDGFAMWESNAILRHLAKPPLWPEAGRARATVDQWMDAQQTQLTRGQSTVFQGLIRTPPEKRDHAAIEAARVVADGVWRMLDAQLAATGAHVAGDAFTLADIAWGVHVHRWFGMDIARSDVPALRAWYDRLLARPAYRAHCAGAIV